jgi:hypothetical protein
MVTKHHGHPEHGVATRLATKALRWVRPESLHLGSALENAMGDDGLRLS